MSGLAGLCAWREEWRGTRCEKWWGGSIGEARLKLGRWVPENGDRGVELRALVHGLRAAGAGIRGSSATTITEEDPQAGQRVGSFPVRRM